MARPIWPGEIALDLVNIPASARGAERHGDLHFRLLEARQPAPMRYDKPPAALRVDPRKGFFQQRQSITRARHRVGPR